MTLKPGLCIVCDAQVWRTAQHAKTEETKLLWPDPASTFATCRIGEAVAPGIPVCAVCSLLRPSEIDGLGSIVALVPASERYRYWFTTNFGVFLHAWLSDHLELEDVQVANVMKAWHTDVDAIGASYNGHHSVAAG